MRHHRSRNWEYQVAGPVSSLCDALSCISLSASRREARHDLWTTKVNTHTVVSVTTSPRFDVHVSVNMEVFEDGDSKAATATTHSVIPRGQFVRRGSISVMLPVRTKAIQRTHAVVRSETLDDGLHCPSAPSGSQLAQRRDWRVPVLSHWHCRMCAARDDRTGTSTTRQTTRFSSALFCGRCCILCPSPDTTSVTCQSFKLQTQYLLHWQSACAARIPIAATSH